VILGSNVKELLLTKLLCDGWCFFTVILINPHRELINRSSGGIKFICQPSQSLNIPVMAKKQYPPFYEKAVPIALAVIGLLVVTLLVVIVIVISSR
jgi:hypothetical protein